MTTIIYLVSHLPPCSVAPQILRNSNPVLDPVLPDKFKKAIVLLRSPRSKLASQE